MPLQILTSLFGRKLGFGHDGSLILHGRRLALGTDDAPVAGGSALTLTEELHAGKEILLDTAAGTTLTLPAATGTRNKYRARVSVLATSNSHIIKVANATDVFRGSILIVDTDTGGAVSGFAAAATDDTITLNRSTTGSVSLGEYIEIEDVAAGVFHVRGVITGTGTVATPFSATVS